MQASVAEAMFLLGFEHNGDKVVASSFAPLLRNVHGTQWAYDLINFNSSHLYTLPSYSMQVRRLVTATDVAIKIVLTGRLLSRCDLRRCSPRIWVITLSNQPLVTLALMEAAWLAPLSKATR